MWNSLAVGGGDEAPSYPQRGVPNTTLLCQEKKPSLNVRTKGACHLFRHTVATLMLEGGADVRYVQQMLGHARLETTMIYTQVSIRKLKEIHTATHPAKLTRQPQEKTGYPCVQKKSYLE